MSTQTPRELAQRIRKHAARGEPDKALAVGHAALDMWPDSWRGYSVYLHALTSTGEIDYAIEICRDCATRFADIAMPCQRLAEMLLRKGRFGEARAAIGAAAERGLGEEERLLFLARVSGASNDWMGVRSMLEELRGVTDDVSCIQLVREAEACFRSGAPGDARRLVSEGLALDPGNYKALLLRHRIELMLGDVPAAIDTLEEMANSPSRPMIEQVRVQLAERSRGLAALPLDAEFVRPVVVDDVTSECVISERGPGDAVAIVFTGLKQDLGFPIAIFDRYLARIGVTAIYLRDFSGHFFGGGITSLGGDPAATTRSLHERVTRIGARRIVMISDSGGALAAIHMGVELGARKAVCFAPLTNVEPGFLRSIGDGRVNWLRNRLAGSVAGRYMSCRDRLAKQSDPPHVAIYYGAAMKLDCAHAGQLEGLDCVDLHPLEGLDRHDAIPFLMAHNGLAAVLETAFTDQPEPRSVFDEFDAVESELF